MRHSLSLSRRLGAIKTHQEKHLGAIKTHEVKKKKKSSAIKTHWWVLIALKTPKDKKKIAMSDLSRSRCLCDTQWLMSLHLIARSDLPASFPSQALSSGKDVRTCQGRAVFATRNAAMAHVSASDRSKRSAGFLSIPGIAIWKGCPDLPRSRCLCDTQCGDGSCLCI